MTTVNSEVKKTLNTLGERTGTYLVDTWKSGSSWYRVWSDGFIEQAVYVASETRPPRPNNSTNATTVSLQKAYKNNRYTVLLQPGTGMGENECEFWVVAKKTGSIDVGLPAYNARSQTSGLMVYACGY